MRRFSFSETFFVSKMQPTQNILLKIYKIIFDKNVYSKILIFYSKYFEG